MAQQEDEEWEERTMVVQLSGILNAEVARGAAQQGFVAVRNVDSDSPLIQIGSSVYTGKWVQTVGTDMIFSLPGASSNEPAATPAAATTSTSATDAPTARVQREEEQGGVRLMAVSDTRLRAQCAIPQLSRAKQEEEDREEAKERTPATVKREEQESDDESSDHDDPDYDGGGAERKRIKRSVAERH